jgi:Ran GTPase-activating protein (RanGAP) involved in mRNA processing and transport
MTYIARTFGQSQNLKCLHLYRNSIGDEGLVNFKGEVMRMGRLDCFPPLELLDLSECNIGALGVESLSSCLMNEMYVHDGAMELILNNNPNIRAEGCRSLKRLISTEKCSSVIRKLSIRKCNIGDEGIIHLGRAFEIGRCNRLCSLDLVDNKIGSSGMEQFASTLMNHKLHIEDLNHLNLAENNLGSEGVLSLVRSLKSEENENGNHSIRTLDLSQTNCGPDSAVGLLKCSSLKSLRLFNNNLREGLENLVDYLHGGHSTLMHLDLAGNRASGATISSLLKAVLFKNDPDNSVLDTLELGGNEINEDALAIIQELEVARPGLDIARDRPSTGESVS